MDSHHLNTDHSKSENIQNPDTFPVQISNGPVTIQYPEIWYSLMVFSYDHFIYKQKNYIKQCKTKTGRGGLSHHVSNSSRDRRLGPKFESPFGIMINLKMKEFI